MHQAFPTSDIAPVLAAVLTHAGLSTGARAGSTAYQTFLKPVLSPDGAAADDAGVALARANANPVAASAPGLAAPTSGDVAAAGANVAAPPMRSAQRGTRVGHE